MLVYPGVAFLIMLAPCFTYMSCKKNQMRESSTKWLPSNDITTHTGVIDPPEHAPGVTFSWSLLLPSKLHLSHFSPSQKVPTPAALHQDNSQRRHNNPYGGKCTRRNHIWSYFVIILPPSFTTVPNSLCSILNTWKKEQRRAVLHQY